VGIVNGEQFDIFPVSHRSVSLSLYGLHNDQLRRGNLRKQGKHKNEDKGKGFYADAATVCEVNKLLPRKFFIRSLQMLTLLSRQVLGPGHHFRIA
jgi:hypothetical protein